MNIILLGVFK